MSFVYLIESVRDYDTLYKIGYSKNPKKRITNIQTGNDGQLKILYTYESKYCKKIEGILHRTYSSKRKNMEWFDLDIKDISDFTRMCEKIEKNLEFLDKFKSENYI